MSLPKEIEDYYHRLALKDFGRGLEPSRQGAALLGNPQEQYPIIHIAGTNGKGSTAAFLSSLLQQEGFRVGLTTSPHLIDIRERIQVDRKLISRGTFIELTQQIRNRLPEEEFLSYFEMTTLLSFEYFRMEKVDMAVVEVGLGGKLDSTNIVHPQVAVLTPISLDHENHLGKTEAAIAEDKCGILKQGMKVVSAPQKKEVTEVLSRHCREKKLSIQWSDPHNIDQPLGLLGAHQKTNAATALLAAEAFLRRRMDQDKIGKALQQTKWPGRLQYLQKNPTLLIDAGHNEAGIQSLLDFLKEQHPNRSIHFLIGVLADKRWNTMFEPLKPLAKTFHCVKPPSNRALEPMTLAKQLGREGRIPIEVHHQSISEVVSRILKSLGPTEMLVATGSITVIGEVLKCFHKHV